MGRARSDRLSPARLAVVRALVAVDAGAFADEALGEPPDRALAWSVLMGVLRRRSALDEVIAAGAARAVRNIDPIPLAALRMGAFEARFSRVPPHAAFDQAVEACRAAGAPFAAGFVNAVLRKQAELSPSEDALTGHPAWLLARWRERHGAEAARAWTEANNEPAVTFVVANGDPAGLARTFQHAGVAALPVADGIFRVSGRVTDLPGYAEGRFWVADPGAMAVADLVPAVDRVLDCCASPGGKAFRLASRGMRVQATDRPERLDTLREGAARLGLGVAIGAHDWSQGPLPDAWPAVLLDAPCTGLGTLRRNPDIRWRRRPSDIPRAAEMQRTLLANAARCVSPGGCLVYAVCSAEPEEGPAVAGTLGWAIEDVYANAPCLGGQDAFWGARLRRPS